jgi:uncharacterized protein
MPLILALSQWETASHKRRKLATSTAIRGVLLIGLVLYGLAVLNSSALALEVPPLRGRITDLAGMLPAERARALEERLKNFERETGHQIAVLTIPRLEGDSLEDFSIRVAESWKIGQKGFDNCAILIIVRDERKLRIEVGYGLEGVLPDAVASRIIREIIVPRFRAGDFAAGIEAGTDSIMKIASGETIPAAIRKPKSQPREFAGTIPALFMAALFALAIGISQRTVPRGALGGGSAAAIATALAAAGMTPAFWLVAIIIGAILGAVGNLLARQSSNRAWTGREFRRHDHWRSGAWGPTFGGGYGGGFGGGGYGGGGFSGGGGGFGGGGASGSW